MVEPSLTELHDVSGHYLTTDWGVVALGADG